MILRNIFYYTVRFFLFCFFKLFFFFKVQGRENIPSKGGFIIASNHLSFLDPPLIAVATPRICAYMAKKELFEGKLFGKIIDLLYAFPVQRDTADAGAIRMALKKLKENTVLTIFPEGSRSVTGEIGRGQPGIGFLAVKSGVPVVPALIIGSDKAMPANAKKVSLFNPVKVYFGKPLNFLGQNRQKMTKEDYQVIADQVVEEIKNLKKNL